MAGSVTDALYQAFLYAAGQQSGDTGQVQYALEELLAELNAVQLQQQQADLQAAKAETKSSSSQNSSSGGSGVLGSVLKSGLGLAPLIGGLVGLIGGGDEQPAPLVKYALPPSVSIDAAESGGQITLASYDQTGAVRMSTSPVAVPAAVASSSGAQVTVNVQAMDARSFMDRSVEIAAAVRDAMLNLNSINDVVNDL